MNQKNRFLPLKAAITSEQVNQKQNKNKKHSMKKFSAIILFICLGLSSILAQTVQISGVVTGAEDNEPLPGVTVMVKGTLQGTTTNSDGRYSIAVPSDGILQFSFVGMVTQEVAVTGKQVIDVVMQSGAQALDEVIVVAYGTARRSSFTGSATTVRAEELDKRKVSNVTKALDGLAPGIQVTSGSGQPGSGSNVYIRGLGSINASNTPLFVVDGIPYDGNINAISPSDIESMTVLKDASAGALYGSRGANGVVLITTKQGKSGVTEVNFRANFGISSRAIPRYETMNPKEFIESAYSAYYNTEVFTRGVHPDLAGRNALNEMSTGSMRMFGPMIDGKEKYNPYNFTIPELIDPATGLIRGDASLLWEDDWLSEVTRNDAYRQEYSMDVTGGVDKLRYMLSFGYLDDKGILETTNFKRYSGRTNIESKPTEWMNVSLGSNFSRTQTNLLDASGSYTSNVWYSAQLMAPVYPVYHRNPTTGDFLLNEFGEKIFDYGEDRPTGSQQNFNSIATLYDDKYSTTINNVSGRGRVELGDAGWAKGLKFSVIMGFDFYGNESMTYYNPYFGNASAQSGRIYKGNSSVMSYTSTQMLSYNKELFGAHTIDVMAAHEYYDYTYNLIRGHKTGFPFGGLYEPDAASTVNDVTGYSHKYVIESYLGRINYDYDNKIYLSASIRSDASSRFHKNYRWKSFWSLGGSYRISKEDFLMSASSWLDNLAVKASYGRQGNDNIFTNGVRDFYPWQALYDLGWANAGEAGALVNSIENQDLTWESSGIFNIGLDASVWDSRLQASVEWYHRTTEDLLLNYPKPLSTGFASYSRNSGSMLNTGFEFTLNGRIIKTQDLEWSATFMGATIKNKILKLTDDGQDIVGSYTILREGEAINSFFVARSAGVDPLTGQALFWADKDADGEDVEPYITSDRVRANQSRYVAGNRFPSLFGSFSTQVKYKGFDFSAAANYSLGGKMYEYVYQGMMNFYYAPQTRHKDYLKAWKQPGDISKIARYTVGESPQITDDMLINASYLSIKNIILGYTFPYRMTEKIGVKALRIYAAADNLHVFTHIKGMDPQFSLTSGAGTDYAYTPNRTFSVGIDLKF